MKVIDLDVQVHWETDEAYLVSTDGEKNHAIWLPKSKIELDEGIKGQAVVTLPEWLAVEKGLV